LVVIVTDVARLGKKVRALFGRVRMVRCLLLGALCGTALGAIGPTAFFLFLAWGEPTTAWRSLGLFAAIIGLFGALPGLLNGLVGAVFGLWGGRREDDAMLLLVPLLMFVGLWVCGRGDPKVGFTLLVGLVPMALVWGAGWAGWWIGSRPAEGSGDVRP
jgi:hypothetical protein